MIALRGIDAKHCLFFDIETVRQERELKPGSPLFDSWEYKVKRNKEEVDDIFQHFVDTAALSPEFAKIACISLGVIRDDKLIMRSYVSHDEKFLLTRFNGDLESFYAKHGSQLKLVGFANNTFDTPFIWRRMMANQIVYCDILDSSDRKPWEMPSLDLAALWKGGGRYASLINVATAMGVPSPKDDICGADVGRIYWDEDDLERIRIYCEKDVLTTANIFRRCRYEPLLEIGEPHIEEAEPLINSLMNGASYGDKEKGVLKKMCEELPVDKVVPILNAVTSTSKYNPTKFKKKHVTELIK